MPTRIGSSGPRVGRRTSEARNGRMRGWRDWHSASSLSRSSHECGLQTPKTLQVLKISHDTVVRSSKALRIPASSIQHEIARGRGNEKNLSAHKAISPFIVAAAVGVCLVCRNVSIEGGVNRIADTDGADACIKWCSVPHALYFF